MKKKSLITIIFSCVLFLGVKAQQDPMYTHYMYNTLSVNPAYAGSRDAMTATLLHRTQWMSFPGAPKTMSFTLHSPVQKGVNLGLSVYNDQIGPVNTTSFGLSYAYRFNLNESSKLALGLNANLNAASLNFDGFNLNQSGDPAFASVANKMMPNFGIGAYYSKERFYAGVSIPRLLENVYAIDPMGNEEMKKIQRHYFLIAGAMIPLNESWDVKPTGLYKVTASSPMQLDLTCELVYEQKFDFGLFYRTDLNVTEFLRTGDGVGFLAGINLNDNLHLGYSFDYSFANPTSYANMGSHEIMLRYDFDFKDKLRIRSPRYF